MRGVILATKGREKLLDAAVALMCEANADALTTFLGPRAVSRKAQVSPGTITHHFAASDMSLGRSALERALMLPGVADKMNEFATGMVAIVAQLEKQGVDAFVLVEEALIDEISLYSSENGAASSTSFEAEETAGLLLAAVAPRDHRAAQAMRAFTEPNRRITEVLCDTVRIALGREWSPGADSASLALAINALAAGFLWFRRFDPEHVPVGIYAKTVVRLMDAFTESTVGEPRDYPASLIPGGVKFNVDPVKRAAISKSAVSAYQAHGWPRLTVSEVARDANISRPTVTANFQDRNGLAAEVWRQVRFSSIARTTELAVAGERRFEDKLRDILIELVVAARIDMQLTHAFLAGVLAYTVLHGPPDPNDLADPRNLVPLPGLLISVIQANATAFRPGFATSLERTVDTASLLVNQVMHLAITRPSYSTAEVVDRILDTTLRGMLSVTPLTPSVIVR